MNAAAPATVSVVIAAYRGERFIAEALSSAYAQTHPIHEVIVVEDGSRDGTEELLRRDFPQARYAWQENAGPPAAYNAGIELASGEFVACLDQDDCWLSDKIARQMEVFERQPEVSVVLCEPVGEKTGGYERGKWGSVAERVGAHGVRPIHSRASVARCAMEPRGRLLRQVAKPDSSGRHGGFSLAAQDKLCHIPVRGVTFEEWFSRTALEGMFCSMSSWVVRRDFVRSTLGGFDVRARSFMDYEALLRITAMGHKVVVLREGLYRHRLREDSYGHSPEGQCVEMRELPAVLRRYDPQGNQSAGHLLSREAYAAGLGSALLRCARMAVRCGDEAYARALLAEAAAAGSGRNWRNPELALATRWPSLYLSVRRLTRKRASR